MHIPIPIQISVLIPVSLSISVRCVPILLIIVLNSSMVKFVIRSPRVSLSSCPSMPMLLVGLMLLFLLIIPGLLILHPCVSPVFNHCCFCRMAHNRMESPRVQARVWAHCSGYPDMQHFLQSDISATTTRYYSFLCPVSWH